MTERYYSLAEVQQMVAEAEQRVQAGWEPMVRALTDELLAKDSPSDMSMGAQYLAGYAAALDAARDAVLEEFGPPRLHPNWQTCADRDHSCYLIQDTLAAIDALRGEAE